EGQGQQAEESEGPARARRSKQKRVKGRPQPGPAKPDEEQARSEQAGQQPIEPARPGGQERDQQGSGGREKDRDEEWLPAGKRPAEQGQADVPMPAGFGGRAAKEGQSDQEGQGAARHGAREDVSQAQQPAPCRQPGRQRSPNGPGLQPRAGSGGGLGPGLI